MKERRPDRRRGTVGFGFAIILGLVIGIFIKRVQFGLILGLVLGLIGSNLFRRR